jgi:membrane-bound lytic murein transglycosylase D
MVVKAGSTLLVPRGAHATQDVNEHLADHANLLLTPEGRPPRKLTFKAGKNGDSVAAVAKRYRVSAEQVAQWNNTTANARFKAGQTVTVMTPAPAAPARKLAQAGTRSGTKVTPRTGNKASKPVSRVRVAQVRSLRN